MLIFLASAGIPFYIMNPLHKFLTVALLGLCASSQVALANRKGFMLNGLRNAQGLIQDLNELKQINVDLVRMPIYFGSYSGTNAWLVKVESVVRHAHSLGMVVVIDFHTHELPGDFTIYDVNLFVDRWDQFSRRFASYKGRIWYDLANEPRVAASNGLSWRQVAMRAAKVIRKNDSRHPIVFSPRVGTNTASMIGFEPLKGISRQYLTVHFYDFWRIQNPDPARHAPYTHGLSGDAREVDVEMANEILADYPSKTGRRKKHLRQRLERLMMTQIETGARIYIGEVAIDNRHHGAAKFFEHFLSIVDEFGFDCTIHAYREAEIWDQQKMNPEAWSKITQWLQR